MGGHGGRFNCPAIMNFYGSYWVDVVVKNVIIILSYIEDSGIIIIK
nr:hypothetical protein [Sedimentibacter sp.]